MNRYFIFKKVRNVDAKKMGEVITQQRNLVEKNGEENIIALETKTEAALPEPIKNIPKKTGRRLVLKSFTPIEA